MGERRAPTDAHGPVAQVQHRVSGVGPSCHLPPSLAVYMHTVCLLREECERLEALHTSAPPAEGDSLGATSRVCEDGDVACSVLEAWMF